MWSVSCVFYRLAICSVEQPELCSSRLEGEFFYTERVLVSSTTVNSPFTVVFVKPYFLLLGHLRLTALMTSL